MKHFTTYNWPSIAWAAFIFVLCMWPGDDVPPMSNLHIDKVAHVTVYAVLSVLMLYGWRTQTQFPALHQYPVITILLIATAYGMLIELLQEELSNGRYFDIYDAVANVAGAVAGCVAYPYLYRRFLRK